MAKTKRATKKVRLAVAMDADGKWDVAGGSWANDDPDVVEVALAGLSEFSDDDHIRITWIEADAFLPEPEEQRTVKGRATDGGEAK